MNRSYKYRIYPNRDQEALINKTFGCVRFVYNKMLEQRKEIYNQYKNDKQAFKKQKFSTPAQYKKEFEWLKEVDCLALCNAQLNLNAAYDKFFRNKSVGLPKFKNKKTDRMSYTTNNQNKAMKIIDEKYIRLSKLGRVRIKLHRGLPENSEIRSSTISLTPSGKYFISILVKYDAKITKIIPSKEKVLGIDYSSGSFYIDNNNQSADYPKFYRKSELKLKKEQAKLSRRKKDGKNKNKQKLRVSKLHEKISNQRSDFLHKLSRKIANSYDAIVFENLNMNELMRFNGISKSTNDNGFGMFRLFSKYKFEEQGKYFVIIDKWFPSSKTCHFCGIVNKNLTLSDRIWKCSCGKLLHRDENAGINIKNEGCRILGIA